MTIIPEEHDLRAQIERAKVEMEDMLRSLMVGTWEWEPMTGKVRVSELGSGILEIETGIDHHFDDMMKLFSPEEISKVNESVNRSMRNADAMEMDYRIITPGGKVKQVMLKRTSTQMQNGQPVLVNGIIQDVTLLYGHQLREEEKRRDMEELIFQNSHLLRASIATISGIADVIRKGLVTDEKKKMELLLDIQQAADEADKVIRDIVRKLYEKKI